MVELEPIELKLKTMLDEKSKHSERSQKHRKRMLKLSREHIKIINNELEFFALEPTPIYCTGFETKKGITYEYCIYLEDDRYVEYKVVTNPDGSTKTYMNYVGGWLDMFSIKGLSEIELKLRTFINKFKSGELDLNYEVV